MNDQPTADATHVTRRDLHFGFAMLWLFLALTLGELMKIAPSWIIVMYFAVAFVLAIFCMLSALGFHRKGLKTAPKQPPPEAEQSASQ
jgi:ABC-type multidrug transport system permease subunit